ncbi:MAG: aspartyl protease family protein [Myxococcota bacterium]
MPTPILSAPIAFQVPDGDGLRAIHCPVVEVTLQGIPTRMIIDTGATHVVLFRAFVDGLTQTLRGDTPGTDHAGASVPTWIMDEPCTWDMGGCQGVWEESLVIEGPSFFDDWGIGGVLSPQRLMSGVCHVFRFAQGLWEVYGADAIDQALGTSPQAASIPQRTAEGELGLLVLVSGALKDGDEGIWLLNTGGKHTEVSPLVCDVDESVAWEEAGKGVSGEPVLGAFLNDRSLVCGGLELALERLLVAQQRDGLNGQLGMDTLLPYTVVIPTDQTQPVILV